MSIRITNPANGHTVELEELGPIAAAKLEWESCLSRAVREYIELGDAAARARMQAAIAAAHGDGLSVAELAGMTGYSTASISRIARGIQ